MSLRLKCCLQRVSWLLLYGGGKGSVALEILEILLGGGININGNCGCK